MELVSNVLYRMHFATIPSLINSVVLHQKFLKSPPSSLFKVSQYTEIRITTGMILCFFLFSPPFLAPPTIILSPTTYTVATQGRATVLVTIQGYPRPTISLYGPRNGMQTLVSDGSDRRVSITRGLNDVYNITVSEVVRADRGEYRIVARNALNPKAEVTFFLNVTGESYCMKKGGQGVEDESSGEEQFIVTQTYLMEV